MNKLALLASLTFFVMCSGCDGDGDDDDGPDRIGDGVAENIPFNSISCPAVSSHTYLGDEEAFEPREEVVREAHEFTELYLTLDPTNQDEVPTIDFDENLAIVLFMGQQTNTSPLIRIGSVTESETAIIVEYENVIPPEGCPVDTSLSYPYCIITMDQTDKSVEFVSQTVEECDRD